MRLELRITDLQVRALAVMYATEMSKIIPNLPTFDWRRTLPRSDLADIQIGEFLQEIRTYFSKLISVLNVS